MLAQHIFLHLTHGVARQLGNIHDALRLFESRELITEGCIHLRLSHFVRHRHNDCNNRFAEVGMRHTNHRRLRHLGHIVEGNFDFLGVDVVAARNHQIF